MVVNFTVNITSKFTRAVRPQISAAQHNRLIYRTKSK